MGGGATPVHEFLVILVHCHCSPVATDTLAAVAAEASCWQRLNR